MKIFFASDHAGFKLKKALVEFVGSLGFEAVDLGPKELKEGDDYPLEVEKVGMEVFKDPDGSKGIILGGSGQGEAIVANRFPNVRAVVYYGGEKEIIKLSREHNDANILSIGARFVTEKEAKEAVELWLKTEFSEESRHIRRLREIDKMEESLYKNP